MVTAITMAQINLLQKTHWRFSCLTFLLSVSCSGSSVFAAELEIKPQLTASAYGFWLREQQAGDGLDKGLAGLLSPVIAINSTSKHVSSAFSLKNESVWYDDTQRSHKSLSSYNWFGRVSGYDGRVTLGLTANSAHRIRNSQSGVFSDIITGSENLSKTSGYGSDLNFSTRASADIYARFGVSYRSLQSEAPELNDGTADFDNDSYAGTLALGSADRQSTLFWQFSADHRKTDRQTGENFTAERANATAGLPLYSGLSAIVRGSYDNNDGGRSFNNKFRSYGVGLEYKFGRASRINVSRNKSVISGIGVGESDFDRRDTYTAAEVFLAPTRRTSLAYTLDQRYTGRTALVQGSYQMRYLSLRLSLTDTVQTLSALDEVTEDLGIFVCPDTAAQFSDCFRPPTNNYQLETGEAFRQLFDTELELSEEIINRRSASFVAGYSRNRLSLSLSISRTEDEYVESARESERDSVSLQASWKLNQHTSLLVNTRYYDIDYGFEDRADENISVEGGLKYQLNSRADVSAMFRRIERVSTNTDFDIEENRVWLSLTQRF